MDGKRFDDFSKILATDGISRRRVVRGLGGGLLGAALAGLGLRRASAADGGNSANAQWCHEHFSGAAAGQCTSDAARGAGLSYQCGPASDGSLKLCGDTCAECCDAGDCTGGGTCASGVCQTCEEQGLKTCESSCISTTECCGDCPAGSTCVSGACQASAPITCTADDVCQPGTCPNSTSGDCYCNPNMQGEPICYKDVIGCPSTYTGCTVNSDCEAAHGTDSVCYLGYCSLPEYLCDTDAECGDGNACVDLNGGCGGGCYYFTGGRGVCSPVCLS